MKLDLDLIYFFYLAFFVLLLVDDQGSAHSYRKQSTDEKDGAGEHPPDRRDLRGDGGA